MQLSSSILENVVAPLRDGKIAIFATDTVMGIGCAIRRPDLLKTICRLKNRPLSQPIALLVSSAKAVEDLCQVKLSRDCRILAEKCWPGALTMLVKVNPEAMKHDTEWWSLIAPQGYLGVRSPDCPELLSAIEELGGAIVATSANLHGEPVPENIAALPKELSSEVNHIWFPEDIKFSGLASTVVKTTADNFELLREGFFSAKQLKELLACDND